VAGYGLEYCGSREEKVAGYGLDYCGLREEKVAGYGLDYCGLREEKFAGCCECGNETSCFEKFGKFLTS